MSARHSHTHLCSVAGCREWENCRGDCETFASGTMGRQRRLCLRHARLAWVHVCEIVSAIVIAACVRDYADAMLWCGPSADTTREDLAALLGYASVEAMREAERRG